MVHVDYMGTVLHLLVLNVNRIDSACLNIPELVNCIRDLGIIPYENYVCCAVNGIVSTGT